MRKRIGIYGWSTGEMSFGVTKTYLNWISSFGEPVVLMPERIFDDSLDLLVLAGGMDLSPASYGEFPSFSTSNTDVFKQHVYDKCLPLYIENKTPVFGICLGFQQLAAAFGSILEQDLPAHKNSPDRWKKGHETFSDVAAIELGLGKFKSKLEVNSHHHQGVLVDNLGDDLDVLFRADNEQYSAHYPDKDIVEAFVHKTLPIAACQWHPEEWYDAKSTRLVHLLLDGDLKRD